MHLLFQPGQAQMLQNQPQEQSDVQYPVSKKAITLHDIWDLFIFSTKWVFSGFSYDCRDTALTLLNTNLREELQIGYLTISKNKVYKLGFGIPNCLRGFWLSLGLLMSIHSVKSTNRDRGEVFLYFFCNVIGLHVSCNNHRVFCQFL